MKQGPSWEANQFSSSQKFPAFMEPEFSLPHSQVATTCTVSEQRRDIITASYKNTAAK
jgi:hypothetical protein